MPEWGIFQLRYLATKLIHQLDELAGVSIAKSAFSECDWALVLWQSFSTFCHNRIFAVLLT